MASGKGGKVTSILNRLNALLVKDNQTQSTVVAREVVYL